MNRGLIALLVAVAGLSVYLSSQSDDELLAPSRQGNGRPARSADRPTDEAENGQRSSATPAVSARATRGNTPAPQKASMEPWLANNLTLGVQQWQARLAANEASQGKSADWAMWRSMQPPPPPPPPRVATVEAPPPPPMAPRFPHSWVGRFNDETSDDAIATSVAVAAASGASAPAAPQKVVRAVLAGPQNTWVVRAGDVIDGQWRVDRIQDRTMSLTYLPLQQQQTVVMR